MNDMLNKFPFLPLRIAYKYKSTSISLSNWFLYGGNRQKYGDRSPIDARDMEFLYEYKNFKYDDLHGDINFEINTTKICKIIIINLLDN